MVFPTVLILTTAVCLTGSLNDLLSKITANVYTQRYAFFVDQGCNILYAMFSLVPVLFTMVFERRESSSWSLKSRLPEGLLRCPQRRFAFMGFLDALGTFLSAVGAPGTPGHLQVVLNQTLILFTMVTAFVWLGTRHDLREVCCASIIFAGAIVAASGSTGGAHHDGGRTGANTSAGGGSAGERYGELWSIGVFLLSNVPMALSNVYKELGFADKRLRLDVWSMTCITTFYQILVTFVVILPLQTLPYLSGDPQRGLSMSECWASFGGGERCFFGERAVGDMWSG